jgi:F-box/WD-40 domain protein 7
MWDIETGECLHVLMGHVAAVRCVQYDGRLVVSGAYDYMVKVWNPETEECLHTLSGHTNRVYSLQVCLLKPKTSWTSWPNLPILITYITF